MKEIEHRVKNLSTLKTSSQLTNFMKHKHSISAIQTLPENRKEGNILLANATIEARVNFTSRPNQYTIRKETYRMITFMNKHTNILIKYYQIQ